MTSLRTQTESVATASAPVGKPTFHSIGIAGTAVAHAPDKIRTVLGSCIGIALFDRKAGVGAMGHVILPDSAQGSGDPAKFADLTVPILREKLISAGAVAGRIEAKIAGGATMFGTATKESLGIRNTEAVKKALQQHAIRLLAEHVGGGKGRKMCLTPETGDVEVSIIGQAAEII